MRKDASRLFWIESALATLAAVLGVVTFFWRDWIEVTGWDPDHHSGSAEWMIAVGLIAVALVLGALARREHARHLPITATG